MDSVEATPEFRRVRDLPRRTSDGAALVADLTDALSAPGGTQRLRALQARALYDAMECRGLFAPLGVGEGKTLISLLGAYVLDAKRPLLLLPANLVQKTQRDREAYAKHWLVPRHVRLMSYEILGRAQSASELEAYRPDLIVCDEVHKLKNRRAAVTRRVSRYMHDHPETLFVALSGTIMRRSLLEFGHILRWALKDGAPVPRTHDELEAWASALDEDLSGRPGEELGRLEPGALLDLCNEEELRELPLTAARRGFRRRLVDTPGVVASEGGGERVDCSIHLRALRYEVAAVTEQHFATLREHWKLPSGETLSQGVDVWRHARELALGLHYEWDPPAPDPWLEGRRAWAAFVRETLSRSRTLDSELQVAQAVAAGKLSDGGLLAAWKAIRDTFEPNTVPVWHDDSALRLCAGWLRTPGVVWTEHGFFAERLSEVTGVPYYGAQGLDANKRFIDDAPAGSSAIVSIDANREGRNLQTKWNRCLFTSPPEGADVWQQAIGRFHRPGQTEDEVQVDVLLGCAEHANAFRKALAGARAVQDTTGAESKLLLADIEWPSDQEISKYCGARWGGEKESP